VSTTLTVAPPRVTFDPLRDKSYRHTLLGEDVAAFLAWKQLSGLRPISILNYEWALNRAAKMYPGTPVGEWTDTMVLHVLASFAAGSRKGPRAALSEFFKWARLTRRIGENPMELVPRIKARPQKTIDVFTAAERAALEALPLEDGALIRLLFAGGLRKGEARRLQDRHILPEPFPGQLRIIDGKGGKDRLIPIGERTAQMVAELRFLAGLGPRDHLWYDRPGGKKIRRTVPIGETSFVRWWTRCVDQAGVRYRNPHVTRHTFATNWLRKGGRITTLSQAMGHESLRTTIDLYAHLDTRDVETDLALIEAEGGEISAD